MLLVMTFNIITHRVTGSTHRATGSMNTSGLYF